MGKGKERWYPNKPQNKFKHCAYDDGTTCKECNYPWSYKCDGNMYKCYKLALHHLASLSDNKRKDYIEWRNKHGLMFGAPRTNYYES